MVEPLPDLVRVEFKDRARFDWGKNSKIRNSCKIALIIRIGQPSFWSSNFYGFARSYFFIFSIKKSTLKTILILQENIHIGRAGQS